MYSPWGKVDRVEKYAPGLVWVSTPSHGGFMVTKKFAQQHLTPAAIKQGDKYGNYLAYEEDVAWAIVAFELPMFWEQVFAYGTPEAKKDPLTYLMHTLSAWIPEYLLERGIRPTEPEYSRYLQRREEEMREAEKRKIERTATMTDAQRDRLRSKQDRFIALLRQQGYQDSSVVFRAYPQNILLKDLVNYLYPDWEASIGDYLERYVRHLLAIPIKTEE